ncbi:helix-turn-helix domain-containing protein [Anaerotignum sp.]|uniref:helix-turn-helix domain-containing protein n=1 Tax=Anaerotignum sp. TaxID=2039241 RepID=UPI002A912CD0|nr:helix-turn-helix transcriptional regulator [Anaerotignum sp.]MCI7657969.1 helix-turn-helix domain-containing protein [Clostridia bacterium]MDY5415902.1 helix-turn-helix transcriptional regulator [Anaerotignum sp.]
MQNKFPQRLRQLRKERGITQTALGRYLHYKHTAVANYESGRNQPSFEDLLKLADYFDVSTDFLLGRSEKPCPSACQPSENAMTAELLCLLQQAESFLQSCRIFLEKDEKKI